VLRLILLLLGTSVARRFWFVLGLAGSGFLGHGFALGLILLGVVTLVGAALNDGLRMRLRLGRALILFAIAYVLIDKPHYDDVVLAIACGLGCALDGIFRIAGAALVRFSGWSGALAVGILELLLAALIFEPYPNHHAETVPICVTAICLLAAFACLRMAFLLVRVRGNGSLPQLFSRGTHPDVAEAVSFGRSEVRENSEAGPLTVHVWTPTGVLDKPERRLLLDRYVAAVDEHGVISTGHAALEAAPDIYISHYPGIELDRNPDDFMRALRGTHENDIPARYLPDYASEAAGWCESSVKIEFSAMNLRRLREFWLQYKQKDVYNLTQRNCAITTVLALETALEGWATREEYTLRNVLRLAVSPELWIASQMRKRAESMTWTPGLVRDYAEALASALTITSESWRAKTKRALSRERFAKVRDVGDEGAMPPQALALALALSGNESASSKRARLVTTAAITLTAAIFGLTYGLSAPLIASILESNGKSTLFVGVNAAMHAIGVLGIAPFLPKLSSRLGSRKLIAAALILTACILPLFSIVPSFWLWFPLRLGLGAMAEIMLVLSESWANQMSDNSSRGRTMAIYTAALSAGFAGGPAILASLGPSKLVFLLGAALSACAVLPLLHPKVIPPASETTGEGKPHAEVQPLRYARLAPLAMCVALVNAAVETAGLSFVPLYAVKLGFTETMGMRLISVLMVGAIVLQLPIGLLSDKLAVSAEKALVIGLAAFSAVTAVLWPFLFANQTLAFATFFVWGGAFVGIYTVVLTGLGRRFQGADLVGIYAMLSVSWGLGALLGPSVVGGAMALSPRYGLPLAVASACAVVTLFAARSKRTVLPR
jgi:predicted MFS family arabinose efflux permease